MSTIRIDRLLSNLGYGSRKEIGDLVDAGRVLLNGLVIQKASQGVSRAEVREENLTVDGEKIDPPAPLTLMLHKPAGYICSHDEAGFIVYDLLPERWKFRKPVLSCAGRLDKDSTGQVILTDDGDLLHRIIHPKSHAPKHYEVTLENELRGDEAALFLTGNFLMAGDAKPLKPALWTASGKKSGHMVLHEGRYHQIRRMFETLDNKVITLHRTQTGGLNLAPLELGKYRILDETDIQKIFSGE
jgi:16S rRNA pseudouridine516 synthase